MGHWLRLGKLEENFEGGTAGAQGRRRGSGAGRQSSGAFADTAAECAAAYTAKAKVAMVAAWHSSRSASAGSWLCVRRCSNSAVLGARSPPVTTRTRSLPPTHREPMARQECMLRHDTSTHQRPHALWSWGGFACVRCGLGVRFPLGARARFRPITSFRTLPPLHPPHYTRYSAAPSVCPCVVVCL